MPRAPLFFSVSWNLVTTLSTSGLPGDGVCAGLCAAGFFRSSAGGIFPCLLATDDCVLAVSGW
eukprot:1189888-Prorocentrum_minimum.AAC.2